MRPRFILFHLLIVLLFCSDGQAATDISVEASLSHITFPVDQGALLSITVNGSGRIAALDLPDISRIDFTSRGQSSRTNWINGKISSSLTMNYLIRAEKPGIYTIPPITVTAAGKSATTKAMSFEVTAATGGTAVSPGSPEVAGDIAFIRVSPTGDHYPGEIVPVTIKAYFKQEYRTDITSLVTLQGDGVVMPQLRENPAQTEEIVKGVRYNVLTWQTTLTGIKEGSHPLTFSLEASLFIPQKRQSRSLFGGRELFEESMLNDPFFDSFFGGYQRKTITAASPQVIFHVIPLPTENRPENFTGAIGNFDLKVSADQREIEVGEPLTLNVEISGSGNFDRVEAPSFPQESPDWKTYSPTSILTDHGYRSTKDFEQAIVARSPAAQQIPALSFSYFDPTAKKYITKTSSPITITVRPSTVPTPVEPPHIVDQPLPAEFATEKAVTGLMGLAPIHLKTGPFRQRILPLWQKSWFIWACGFCTLTLIALLFIEMRRQRVENSPERAQRKNIKRLLHDDLERLEKAKASGNGYAFLALCRTAIQNQLGPRWNMTPTAISLADLSTRLKPESTLCTIFRTADEAAYGGAMLTDENMEDFLKNLRAELEDLS